MKGRMDGWVGGWVDGWKMALRHFSDPAVLNLVSQKSNKSLPEHLTKVRHPASESKWHRWPKLEWSTDHVQRPRLGLCKAVDLSDAF